MNIEEIRNISRNDASQTFAEASISRYLSLYLTRLYIFLNISADIASSSRIVYILICAVILIIPSKAAIFAVPILLFLEHITDYSDGDLARYYRTTRPKGKLLDWVIELFQWPVVFLGLIVYSASWNIYSLGSLVVVSSIRPIELLSEYINIKWLVKKEKKKRKKVGWGTSILLSRPSIIVMVSFFLLIDHVGLFLMLWWIPAMLFLSIRVFRCFQKTPGKISYEN